MEPEAKYTLVGGSVLVLLALLVGAVAWLASASRGTDVQRYKIYFARQSLEGLQVRSDVRMRGIRVGAVTGFSFSGATGHGRGRDRHRPGHAGQGEHAGDRRSQSDHRAGDDPAAEPEGGQLVDPAARPGQRDPVIAEGASQLQQFSETANELAQRADETMRRINMALSNENQAVLTEILVNLRNLSRNAEGAAVRADAALVSIGRTADSVGVATTALSRDVSRLADRYDAVGVEASTTLRDASTAMRQVSSDVSQLSRHAETLLVDTNAEVRLTSQQLAAPPMPSARRRASSATRARRSSVRAKRAWGRREPMNRRSAGLGLTLAGLLAGCGGLGRAPAHRYFVLETAPSRLAPGPLQRDAILLVAPTTASSFYDTQEIIYSRRSGERAYYQLSSWTEPPNRGLADAARRPRRRQRRLSRRGRDHQRRARRPAAAHPPGRALPRCRRAAGHGPGDA